jgi:hypothetical protein
MAAAVDEPDGEKHEGDMRLVFATSPSCQHWPTKMASNNADLPGKYLS